VVVEGKVLISHDHQTTVLLESGQVAEVRNGRVHFCESTPVVDRRIFWTAGLLSFSGETLTQVAQKFNRYDKRKLKIDPSIANVPIGGLFPSHNPEGFADALQRLGIDHTNLRDSKTGEETILLRGKAPSDPSLNTGDPTSVDNNSKEKEP
jgi:ferric-dicitrate binding protein FerR (iron transport regulator)